MLYNYGAAILRAVGDTKRPLIFLTIFLCLIFGGIFTRSSAGPSQVNASSEAGVLLLLAVLWGGSSIWFAPLCSELLCLVMALALMRRFRRDTAA